jgi:hypothetical protein
MLSCQNRGFANTASDDWGRGTLSENDLNFKTRIEPLLSIPVALKKGTLVYPEIQVGPTDMITQWWTKWMWHLRHYGSCKLSEFTTLSILEMEWTATAKRSQCIVESRLIRIHFLQMKTNWNSAIIHRDSIGFINIWMECDATAICWSHLNKKCFILSSWSHNDFCLDLI